MKKHISKYFLFWDNVRPDGSKALGVSIKGFEFDIGEVSMIRSWAGNLEIAALAATLDHPICVIHELGQVHIFNLEVAGKIIVGHDECLKVDAAVALSLPTKMVAWSALWWSQRWHEA